MPFEETSGTAVAAPAMTAQAIQLATEVTSIETRLGDAETRLAGMPRAVGSPMQVDAAGTVTIPAATASQGGYMTAAQAGQLAALASTVAAFSTTYATQTALSTTNGVVNGHTTQIAALQTNLAADEANIAALLARTLKVGVGVLSAGVTIALNGTANVTILFGTAMPDASYALDYSFSAAGVSLAGVSVTNVAKSTTGVTLTLKSTGAALNATLTFVAVAVRYA